MHNNKDSVTIKQQHNVKNMYNKKPPRYYSVIGDKVQKLLNWYEVGRVHSIVRRGIKDRREIGRRIRAAAPDIVADTDPTSRADMAWVVERWDKLIDYMVNEMGVVSLAVAGIEEQSRVIADRIGFAPRTLRNHIKKLLKASNKEEEERT